MNLPENTEMPVICNQQIGIPSNICIHKLIVIRIVFDEQPMKIYVLMNYIGQQKQCPNYIFSNRRTVAPFQNFFILKQNFSGYQQIKRTGKQFLKNPMIFRS